MKRNRKYNVGRKMVGSLAAIALAPVAALAQGAAEFEAVDLHTPVAQTHVIPGFGHRLDAEIDDSGGVEFSETAFSVRGGPAFDLREDISLYTLASYRYSHYDWKNVGADPFENIHYFRATPVVRWQMDDVWTIY